MSEIETRVGLDYKRLKGNFKSAIKSQREEQVTIVRRADAWKYIIDNWIPDGVSQLHVVQTYLSSYLGALEFDIQLFIKGEMMQTVYMFADDPHWTHRIPWNSLDGPIEPTINTYDKSIAFKFYLEDKCWDYIQNRFNLDDSKFYYETILTFYPQDEGQCHVVDDGEEVITRTRKKLRIECSDNAEAW